METRFDPFEQFEGLDDVLLRVFAGLVVAQRGLGPVARVSETACVSERTGCVVARLARSEVVLHGFAVADRLAVVTKSSIDPPSVAVQICHADRRSRMSCPSAVVAMKQA